MVPCGLQKKSRHAYAEPTKTIASHQVDVLVDVRKASREISAPSDLDVP